jgi:hypothetical protein
MGCGSSARKISAVEGVPYCWSIKLGFIRIPNSVRSIGDFCFEDCKWLQIVRFEEASRLKSIGKGAFAGCQIGSIRIPPSVEIVQSRCFFNCKKLREVEFQGKPKVKPGAFDKCKLSKVRMLPRRHVKYNFSKRIVVDLDPIEIALFAAPPRARRSIGDRPLPQQIQFIQPGLTPNDGTGTPFWMSPGSPVQIPVEVHVGQKSGAVIDDQGSDE